MAYELTCPLSKVKNIGELPKSQKMQRKIMLFKTKLENRVYANLNITFQLFRTRLDHVESLQSVKVRI
jgi:hypothetical protein